MEIIGCKFQPTPCKVKSFDIERPLCGSHTLKLGTFALHGCIIKSNHYTIEKKLPLAGNDCCFEQKIIWDLDRKSFHPARGIFPAKMSQKSFISESETSFARSDLSKKHFVR